MLSIIRNFALARSYADLFKLSEAELAARGMDRDTLKARYLRDLDAIASAADRRDGRVALPA